MRGGLGSQVIPNTSALHLQVQLTDFENSAYVVFVVLLTRVILSYKLDFLIPLSKVKMSLLIPMNVDKVNAVTCLNSLSSFNLSLYRVLYSSG